MKNTINNRLAFNIYIWTRFSLLIFFVFFLLCQAFKIPQTIGFNVINGEFIVILAIFALIIFIFEYMINPAYFEALILNGKIVFRNFEPNRKNGLIYILMLFYKKHLKEHIIERQSYNSYKIKIDHLGFRKKLVFQKIDNGKIYESTAINISFLSTRKYTELILSIDRLQEKINLN